MQPTGNCEHLRVRPCFWRVAGAVSGVNRSGSRLCIGMHDFIHITVPGSPHDPRHGLVPPPGVVLHYSPPLHPDDVTVLHGIPVTTPSRTLIDLAEVADGDELREAFRRARELGLLDLEALRRARARVEWRPSLALFDAVSAEFYEEGGC
jgi:hypothetical protein